MQWSALISHRKQGAGASSKKEAFLSHFHCQPEMSVSCGRPARAHCGFLTLLMQCGEAAFLRHHNRLGSNSSPWLLKTEPKTTIINYSIQGPGENLETSFQGQGFSGNRSLLTIGRASLSWWLHLQDSYTVCIFSVLEQWTGTYSADSQHTEGLTLHFMTEVNPNKVCVIQPEGKRNQFCFLWVGLHRLIRKRNESLKYTYRKGICHLHERWEWLHPKLMKSSLCACLRISTIWIMQI